MIKRVVNTLFDIFPVLNRPMTFCAVLSCLAVLFLYIKYAAAAALLILFLILSITICFIAKNRKITIIIFIFMAVCASTVNEFLKADDLNALVGQTIDIDFVAIEDSVGTGKVTKVSVYTYGSDVIPDNTKLELYHFLDEKIFCGDKLNATVKISGLDENYKMYNYGNGVYISSRILKINSRYKRNSFFYYIGCIRRFIVNTILNNFSGDIAGILIALNSGDKSYLSSEFSAKVLICGISHIMVVSGLHLSIVIGSFFKFCEKIFYNRLLKAFLSLVLIFLICALCGFRLSIMRAGIMFVFCAISPLFLRRNDLLNSLGASVLLLLFLSPFCLFSVSFQLSVLATLAVVWIAPFYVDLIISKLYIKTKTGKSLISVFIVSISAMIFTAPVLIATFGTISLLSPICFFLVTFPVTFALEFNTASLLISAIKGISFLAKPLFLISGINALYIHFVINNLGILEFMLIRVGFGGFIASLFMIFAVISGMYLSKYYTKLMKRKKLAEVKYHAGNI